MNGRPVRAPENVYAAFVGTVGQADSHQGRRARPSDPQARTYTVKPIGDEGIAALHRVGGRRTARRWRRPPAAASPTSTCPTPRSRASRSSARSTTRRWTRTGSSWTSASTAAASSPTSSSSGCGATRWPYWSSRDGGRFRTPGTAIDGPKCILVNEYAGSGGDAFPLLLPPARASARSSASAPGAGSSASATTCRWWTAAGSPCRTSACGARRRQVGGREPRRGPRHRGREHARARW